MGNLLKLGDNEMSDKPRVVDGADRRRARLLEMLQFIHNNAGATTQEINRFMVLRFGLKYDTTAKYIMEMHLAGIIKEGETGKWFTTGNYKKFAKWLYG